MPILICLVYFLMLTTSFIPIRTAAGAALPVDDPSVVSITQFLDAGCRDADATLAVREALAYCRSHRVSKLIFPPGTYRFSKDYAAEKFVSLTNNSSGVKRFAFLIEGFKDFEIDGGGAIFMCRGYVVPFLVDNSQGVALRNFSVDFERTFHSEGKILAVGSDSVDVAFGNEFPYRIREGRLDFVGRTPEDADTEYPAQSLLEFDAQKRETAFMAKDYFCEEKREATEIAPGKVRVHVPGVQATVGNVFVFGAAHRLVPGIVVQDSGNVRFADVTIHHAGAMGLLAQRSRDLLLERVRVTPSAGRILSTTADATHFANCAGKISLVDCLFENQADDATNIHGVYAQVARLVSPTELDLRLGHPEQSGFEFVRAGGCLELVDHLSLNTLGTAEVRTVQRLNGELTRVTLNSPCPPELQVRDVVADLASAPEVLIRGCTIRNNRARGILLGSRGRTVVEDNDFHTPGAAILMEGDGTYWFEQAGVRELIVRNNRFDNCNFGVWGNAVIQVGAGIDKARRASSRYNRGILIEDNTFLVFDGVPLLSGYSIDGLLFRHNRVTRTTAYPETRPGGDPVEITDSANVRVED